MIPRSLPPLPPQVSLDHQPEEEQRNSLSVKPSRPRRKNKTHKNTENNSDSSYSNHDVKEKAFKKDVEQLSGVEKGVQALNPDGGKGGTGKINSLSVLNRLKLKRQNLRETEENFEMKNEPMVEGILGKIIKEKYPVADFSSCVNGNLVSQPVAKMFVEEERGFRAISDFSGPHSQPLDTACQASEGVHSAVELAVKTQKFFHTFSTFCHGLLAGMALWQCIFVYQLGPPNFEETDFLSHYSYLSQPMQTLFYFLFVICIISAFDRYDIGNPQCSNSKCVVACRSGIIVVIIYPISLLFSLSIANLDDKMSLYNYNVSFGTSENGMDVHNDFFYWKVLNLGRCIGAVVGWIIVALQPNVNNFLHRLEFVGCELSNKLVSAHYSGPV